VWGGGLGSVAAAQAQAAKQSRRQGRWSQQSRQRQAGESSRLVTCFDSCDCSAPSTKYGILVTLRPWIEQQAHDAPGNSHCSCGCMLCMWCCFAYSCSVGARASAGICCLSPLGLGPNPMMIRQGRALLQQQQQEKVRTRGRWVMMTRTPLLTRSGRTCGPWGTL
jgi:hypothetical protein